MQEGSHCCRFGAGIADGRGVNGVVLYLGGQAPDQRHAFGGKDFADLMDAERGFAVDDMFGHGTALELDRLGVNLLRDATLLKQLHEINTAGAARCRIDVGRRFCIEQRLFEMRDGIDGRSGRADRHHHANADLRQIGDAVGMRFVLATVP